MPRKSGRRRPQWSRYLRGQIDFRMPTGALAAGAVAAQTNGDTLLETARVSSVVATYSMGNFTPLADRGPAHFGIAHSDYTGPEIQNWITAAASWDQGDLVAKEVADRLIRRIGTFDNPDAVTDTSVFNDGRPVKTRLNWQLRTGQAVRFWMFNSGEVDFIQSDLHVQGHANIWFT